MHCHVLEPVSEQAQSVKRDQHGGAATGSTPADAVQAGHHAAKTWCRLKSENQLPKVIQSVTFALAWSSPIRQHRVPLDHAITQLQHSVEETNAGRSHQPL
jgi:hypothetical protein